MAHATPPTPSEAFRFCPRCGAGPAERPETHVLCCPACGLHYHLNPVVAAGVLVEDGEGRVLFVRRAKEPARGRLAFPGGFVDFGETAEAAARREVGEETGLDVDGLAFLGSWPNVYEWKGLTYPVVDLYFTGRVAPGAVASALHEVAEVRWLRPDEVEPADLAFPSTRAAFARYTEVRDPRRRG
jgi:ADP-ribose pyrophosphatase YjhB (NUDIX family)